MVGGVGGLQGTLAELIAVDANLLAHKPKSLSIHEAAALPLSTITAWEGLVDRANVRASNKVLIHAGAGGVGHIAVQIARAFGAEVFATVAPDKKNVVKEFGATPIDYRSLSVEEYVAACTAGQGFDIVYDTVGGATLDASFSRQAVYRARTELPGMGLAFPGSALFPRSYLLRRLHVASITHRRGPRASREDTRQSRRTRRSRQAEAVARQHRSPPRRSQPHTPWWRQARGARLSSR